MFQDLGVDFFISFKLLIYSFQAIFPYLITHNTHAFCAHGFLFVCLYRFFFSYMLHEKPLVIFYWNLKEILFYGEYCCGSGSLKCSHKEHMLRVLS